MSRKAMFLTVLFRKLIESFWCHRAATKVRNYAGVLLRNQSFKSLDLQGPSFPNITKCSTEGRASQSLVCDIDRTLLTSHSFFPYFMLVAFEGGSILRAVLLLLSCPFLWLLDRKLQIRVMTFISFCGLKLKDMESVSRVVLPKFYLENLNARAYEVLAATGSKVVFTSVPRVMVEGFLKEYLVVDEVIGTELHSFGCYFTGLISSSGLLVKHRAVKEYFGEKKPDIDLGSSTYQDLLFISSCKEAYLINKEQEKKNMASQTLPRNKYPKPLIFHDGRLAFFPTPLATLQMFMWFPIGIILVIFRLLVGILLPYKLSTFLLTLSGVDIRVKGSAPPRCRNKGRKGVLYLCSHRTLLDPIILSISLAQPITVVTYSLSKFSELLAPIKTVRLTRDRTKDGETMQRLLGEGDLVVGPEGTTCREPYLLRFSSLFTGLADVIVPVAMNVHITMFYGTTASGLKWLDSIFFLMNPRPCYHVQFLGKLPRELTCAGGRTSHEVANHIQRQIADALGFECTNLTRRDKYLMLARNEVLFFRIRRNEDRFYLVYTIQDIII